MENIKREENHTEEVRSKILNSAKELLAQDGYDKTTIRRIVEHSGVLTGSIYYFFKNKEDIFKAMLLELTRDCIKKIHCRCQGESPLFKYAAICEVELRVLADNPIVRGTYTAGYNSHLIFEGMVDQFALLAKELFAETAYDCTDEEYYEKTLMIKGAMHACLSALYFQREVAPEKTRQALLRLAMQQFSDTEQEMENVLQKMRARNDLWASIGRELVENPLGKS